MATGIVHEDHRVANLGNTPDALGDRYTAECYCGHRVGPNLSLRELLDQWGVHLTHETLTQVVSRQHQANHLETRVS